MLRTCDPLQGIFGLWFVVKVGMNTTSIYELSFFAALFLVPESLVSRLQTLMKKMSKIFTICLEGQEKWKRWPVIIRERSQESCYNVWAFWYNIEVWGVYWRLQDFWRNEDHDCTVLNYLHTECSRLFDRIWMREMCSLQHRQIF